MHKNYELRHLELHTDGRNSEYICYQKYYLQMHSPQGGLLLSVLPTGSV